jgi:hypothetical protein
MVYQLITVTQTALTKQLVEDIDAVMLRLTLTRRHNYLNVLKGCCDRALRFSCSNGVMIVMKKVETERSWCNHISSLTLGTADSSTLPRYQNKYGAGYGPITPLKTDTST